MNMRLLRYACIFALVSTLSVAMAADDEKKLTQPAAASPAPTKAGESFTQELLDGKVKYDMIWCPPGKFMMGSPESEKGHKDIESPQHEVELDGFWIGKREIKWDVFDAYYEDERFYRAQKGGGPPEEKPDLITRPSPYYAPPEGEWGKYNRPAIRISHYGAVMFCRYLTHVTGRHYRLPTEAEWEYACRAGTTTAYSWGDDLDKAEDYCWHDANSWEEGQEVAKLKPNPWGIYDMHGNMREWTADYYSSKYYKANEPDEWPKNPTGPEPEEELDPRCDNFVVRGGCWGDPLIKKSRRRKTIQMRHRSAARNKGQKWWRAGDPQEPKSIWWLPDGQEIGIRLVCEGPVEEK